MFLSSYVVQCDLRLTGHRDGRYRMAPRQAEVTGWTLAGRFGSPGRILPKGYPQGRRQPAWRSSSGRQRPPCATLWNAGDKPRERRAGNGSGPVRQRAIGSAGERLVHTEEVTGSIPVSPTQVSGNQRPFQDQVGQPLLNGPVQGLVQRGRLSPRPPGDLQICPHACPYDGYTVNAGVHRC
jgi:hypothetical protein